MEFYENSLMSRLAVLLCYVIWENEQDRFALLRKFRGYACGAEEVAIQFVGVGFLQN